MRLFRYLMIGVIVIIITGMMVSPVNAIPPLPSSLFGTVHLNGEKVPEGTSIRALIDDVVMGEGQTMIFQGESVYSLDINGDDPDTKEIDGGVEGDIIHFNVGGVIAEETGVWQGGTNVELNLSVITSDPLATPKPTDNPLPTQTEIGNRSESPETEHNSLLTPDPTPGPTSTSDFNEVYEVTSSTEVGETDQKSNTTEEVQYLPAIEGGSTLTPGAMVENSNEARDESSEDHLSLKPLAIIGLVVVIIGSVTGIILRKHIGH
jgi:hypothetical protein